MRDELKLLNAVLESQLENDVSSSSNISLGFLTFEQQSIIILYKIDTYS